MRRYSALLATAALAASVLLVPNAAHADVKDAFLTVDFDQLARDRVAKLSLRAKSVSGVTSVRGFMRYQELTAEPYASFDLTRTEGTDNDGVWQAEYRPDIKIRPGYTYVDVVVTTADGLTRTLRRLMDDCYTTTISGFTSAPSVIDADHPDVTMSGRVLVQKVREDAPEPVAGGTVRTASDVETTTGGDGSFTVKTSGVPYASITVPRQMQLCPAYKSASLIVNKQATEITAQIKPASTVAPYTRMAVDGKVLRYGAAGLVPAANAQVQVEVPSALMDLGGSIGTSVRTAADGTFHTYFTAAREAGKSGTVTARVLDEGFYVGSQTSVGSLNIRNISEITGFDAFPEPHAYGDSLSVHGTLLVKPDFTNVSDLPVVLEFSPDGKAWTTVQSQTMSRPGNFYFNTPTPVNKDGYWRARYAGSELNTPAVAPADYIDVKYRTQWYDFNASPEPVKKGGTITVKGLLYRFRDVAGPGPNAPVYVYFKRSGSTTWTQMAATTTDSSGWFRKTFKASADGYWMASYKGSSSYYPSDTPADYVDVR
ncbi:hypothetical protein [Actinomadura sp. 3N508]|uniref:hypothetical protein n=1 Tax=Actinomadura sp. 3N508 TaxID=3375153 RepID=UPI00379A10C2